MKKTYLVGRPPWYDATGTVTEPLIVGVAGASAAGKTSVCKYPSRNKRSNFKAQFFSIHFMAFFFLLYARQ
jgi:hypothetical protein